MQVNTKKIKEYLRLDKKKFLFFVFGCLFVLALEQQGWWGLILFNHGEFHNDWWIFISEDVKSWEEAGMLKVLYTASAGSAMLVYNIWTVLIIIGVGFFCLSAAIAIYDKVKRR
jgi:hypothetical protein